MATVTTAQIGSGLGPYATDIVVKDIDLTISNYVKDRTPVCNMVMNKKRKINSDAHIWDLDTYRLPTINAKLEAAAVDPTSAQSNTRSGLANFTQIFTTVVGASGTARAVEQAGGDPQAYQQVKQLTEIFFDVELQLVRADAASIKYSGQTSAQATGPNNGQRFGSLFAFAGTVSSNPTSGTSVLNVSNSDSDDTVPASATLTSGPISTNTPFNGNLALAGRGYWSGAQTLQQFSPFTYKQLVTVAEQRFNAKLDTIICPTSVRTHLSDTIPTSRSINRFNPADKGDTISTYEGDFNYTYSIDDDWIMDQAGSDANSLLFLNTDVLQWGSLRELGPNAEVYSNADASLDQYIMEGTLIVRNPAGVALLRGISATGAAVTTNRPATQVQRYVQ